ncbi:MAG: hypothetical protein ACO201_02765 [Rickettsiales bacterium]
MKKIILFLVFLTLENSFAQQKISNQVSAQVSADKKNNKPSPYKKFDDAIANLSESKKNKFHEINNKYFQELTKNNTEYQKKYKEISNKKTVVMNFYTIFSKQEPKGGRSEIAEEIKVYNQKIVNEFKSLTPDQQKKIKKEAMIYRKAMNKAQKERRIAMKNLFKEDFEAFKESEDDIEIADDEKLLEKDLPKVNNQNNKIKKK